MTEDFESFLCVTESQKKQKDNLSNSLTDEYTNYTTPKTLNNNKPPRSTSMSKTTYFVLASAIGVLCLLAGIVSITQMRGVVANLSIAIALYIWAKGIFLVIELVDKGNRSAT